MSDASEPEPIEPTEALAEWSQSESEEMEIEFAGAPEVAQAEAVADASESPVEPAPEPAPVPRSEPEPTPFPPILAAIASLDQSVQRRLDALQSTFEREVRAEATREKVVDRLHAELQ